MMNLERIAQHLENGGRDEIRVIPPAKFVRKMKLLDYAPDPNELRWRELDKRLCQ